MARPQTNPRENARYKTLNVNGVDIAGSGVNLQLEGGLSLSGETTDVITQNSTALLLPSGLALSGESTDIITQNSTALIMPSELQLDLLTAAPSGRHGPGHIVMIGNGTGNMIAINTTGTTWKYLNVTSKLA